MNRNFQRGFSFIELSISLIIIGLLIVSVLAGQSLVKSSRIRSVSSDSAIYQSSMQIFRTKYGGLPGDAGDITAQISNNTGMFNGDSDGTIVWNTGVNNCTNSAGAASSCSEGAQFFFQLAAAGMINSSFSGTAAANAAVISTNIPKSNLNSSGFGVNYSGTYAYNHLTFAAQTAASINTTAAISPNDAAELDRKLDDGLPNTGLVISSGLANCATGVGATDTYKFDEDDTIRCALIMRLDPAE